MSEVKPEFAPKVKAIWDECGIYVESINSTAANREIEFFAKCLVDAIAAEFEDSDGSFEPRELLEHLGYINE